MKRLPLLMLIAALTLAPAARAQDAAVWRLGLVQHNIHIGGYGDMQSHEGGANIEAELVSKPIQGLSAIWSPRAYVMGSVNTHGDTSFAAAGLYWEWRPWRAWSVEPGFGLAIHDGELHNPYPDGDLRAAAFQHDNQLLGTRLLFRDTLALDRDIGHGRALGLVFEHLSNGGNLFGHRDNESLNELGLRFSSKFR
jgi:lipid A 3-O-deacylase